MRKFYASILQYLSNKIALTALCQSWWKWLPFWSFRVDLKKRHRAMPLGSFKRDLNPTHPPCAILCIFLAITQCYWMPSPCFVRGRIQTHIFIAYSEHCVHDPFLRFISHTFRVFSLQKVFFPAPSRWFAENKSMNLIPTRTTEWLAIYFWY